MYKRIMVAVDAVSYTHLDVDKRQMEAITRGTGEGATLFINIVALLIVLVALVSLANQLLGLLPVVDGTALSPVSYTHLDVYKRQDFRRAAQSRDVDYLFEQYMQNADAMATIAREKYRFVGFAFRGLLLTVLAYVALLATR